MRLLRGWDAEDARWLHLVREDGQWTVRQEWRDDTWRGPGLLPGWGTLRSPWKRLHDDFAATADRPHRAREERERLRVYSALLEMLLRTQVPRLLVQPRTQGGMEETLRPPQSTEPATLQAYQRANARDVDLGPLLPDTPALAPFTPQEVEAFRRLDEAHARLGQGMAWDEGLSMGLDRRSQRLTLSQVGFNTTFTQALVYFRVVDPDTEDDRRAHSEGVLFTLDGGAWKVAETVRPSWGRNLTR